MLVEVCPVVQEMMIDLVRDDEKVVLHRDAGDLRQRVPVHDRPVGLDGELRTMIFVRGVMAAAHILRA